MGLTDFLVGDTEAKVLRQTNKKKAPSANYVALALVPAGKFPSIGGTYTNSAAESVTITAANIFENLKDLAFQGGAWVFGNGTINGKKGKPSEVTEGEVYGTSVKARPTGEVNEMAEFVYKHAFLNTAFFNDLRRNARAKDVWLFTESTVQKIDWEECKPIFESIGCEIGGDRNRTISGGFAVSWNNKNGELVPELGVSVEDLDADGLVYTFDTIGSLVNCTQNDGCAGDCITFTRTAAGTCGFTRDVVEAKGCGKHYLYYNDNESFPGGVTGSVNPTTGAISLTALSAGTHRFTHAFENEVGVFGYYCFKVIAS